MGSNKKLLLVHKDMKHVTLDQSINVMLTPQFYTMKKEELPIKYHYQAKKIAPSFFDGLLDTEKHYSFFVFKEGKDWVFIAYNPEEIMAFLNNRGISSEYVSRLFFAQQAKQVFMKPVMLGKKEVLMTIDGTVVIVPRSVLSGEVPSGQLTEQFTPSKGITLSDGTNRLINQKEAILLVSVFIIFAGAFMLEGWEYNQGLKGQKRELRELLDAYPSLQSKMQRESISAKYSTIDAKERKKRETIKTLASMIFKGVTLTAYHMNEKDFKATFSCDSAKSCREIESLAKKSHFKVTSGKGDNIVLIEGSV